MPTPFPNPESAWDPPSHSLAVDRVEVERRLGPTSEPLEVLSGGRANINVRIGSSQVLRIYRRDGAACEKEQALLGRDWRSFAVPAVRGSGDDFLLLEYVPHGRLGSGAEHGSVVGRALSEIHQTRYPQPGFLGTGLTVPDPFPDVVEALASHALAALDRPGSPMATALRGRLDGFISAERRALERAAGAPVLLHGDFKASNLHWTPGARLLVLDWEFAWAGPALMDIGQLLRWDPPAAFVSAFAESYTRHGGVLCEEWLSLADAFDLFNLASLLDGAPAGSRRARDVERRMTRTLDARRIDLS